MPIGEKSHKVKVPTKILNNKKLYISFLRGLFDTDGCIHFEKSYNKNASKWQKEKHHIPKVAITTVSKELSNQTAQMFQTIGLKFSVRTIKPYKNNSEAYRIESKGKKRVKTFFSKIKPKNSRHIKKFEKWLSQGFY